MMNEGLPTYKVTGATLAAALTSILVWLLEQYGHVDIPSPIEMAAVVVVTFIVGYFIPEHNPSVSAKRHVVKDLGLEDEVPS